RQAAELRRRDPEEYRNRAMESIASHVRGMLDLQKLGAVTFDYGNNIRTFAYEAGVQDAYDFPGFVAAYIRPLFCEGRGPFRWVALSGEPSDILRTDELVLQLFPHDEILSRWIHLAQKHVRFQGLPARICWLGYGERDKFGLAINDLVARGELKAPIVIGRDHLDCGSVASPYRETEKMLDGSDAVADWALLNALLNTASGASWVSIHDGDPGRAADLGRDKCGLAINDLVARGELKAPIVIGRDHLDCGSVASPYRETEKMLDGSDAVADWALLNALLNTASGASWVSIHNGDPGRA